MAGIPEACAAVIRTNMPPDFYDHDGPGGKPCGVDEVRMLAANVTESGPSSNHARHRSHAAPTQR